VPVWAGTCILGLLLFDNVVCLCKSKLDVAILSRPPVRQRRMEGIYTKDLLKLHYLKSPFHDWGSYDVVVMSIHAPLLPSHVLIWRRLQVHPFSNPSVISFPL